MNGHKLSRRQLAAIIMGAFVALGIIGSLLGKPKPTAAESPAAHSTHPSPTAPAATHTSTPKPPPAITTAPPASPATTAPAPFGDLVFQTVNPQGYTVGMVGRNGDVTAFTPTDKGVPIDCQVTAVAVAIWHAGAWVATAVKPLDILGGQPLSLMATFFGPAAGPFRFTADMSLAPAFRTRAYYGANSTNALVLKLDCSW